MAIKKKGEVTEIPDALDDLALKGFTFQQLEAGYKARFGEVKTEVEAYLKSTTEIEVTEGEGIKTPYGSINYSSGAERYEYDHDKILELVKKGKLTLEQVLLNVSSYKRDEFEKSISTAVFKTVATLNKSKESLTFKATPEFKEKIADELDKMDAPVAPAPAKPAAKKAAKSTIVEDLADPKDKAIAAKAKLAAKSAKKSKGASEDLDEILGKK